MSSYTILPQTAERRRAELRCEACGRPLKPRQIGAGNRYCSPDCARRGATARRPERATTTPQLSAVKEPDDMGIVHDLVGDQFDTVTGEDLAYPAPTRCDQCAQPYRPKRKDQRFCSKDCSRRWHNAQPKHPVRDPVPGPAPAAIPTAGPDPGGARLDEVVDRGLRDLVAQAVAVADTWQFEATIGGVRLTLASPAR